MKTLIFFLILCVFIKVFFLRPYTAVYPNKSLDQLQSKPAIIFIPGYYGSALREVHSKRRYFVNIPEILFGSFSLSLHPELLTPPARQLETEGVMGAVTVIPSIYKINVYSDFIAKLQASFPMHQIITFAYDWRQDLGENTDRFATLVNGLSEKNVPNISVVAHSMGGLITTHYLAYGDSQTNKEQKITWAGSKKIQKVVFMGVPFGGTMSIFRNMQYGANFDWNKELLPADAVASFPASYHLLPRYQTKLLNTDSSMMSVNVFDPNLWIKQNLGLMRRQELAPETKMAREKFTTEQLEKALRFSDRIQLGQNLAFPIPTTTKVLNIVGRQTPTLDGGYFDSATHQFLFFEKEIQTRGLSFDVLQNDGDGTVTTVAAEVPAAMQPNTTTRFTSYRHDKLFNDPTIYEALRGFLN